MTASGMAGPRSRDTEFIVGRAREKCNSWGLVLPELPQFCE
jgi:hypothetical protein